MNIVDKSKNNRARRRPGKNTFTTKSGSTVKLHRSLTERWKASREAKARRRAAYLSTLPKNRFKRILYRLHPRRLAKFWFSHDGAIMALKITGVSIVVVFFITVGLFAYFRKDLPNITDLSGELGGTVRYYDRTGEVLLYQDAEAVKRTPVSGDKIAQSMKDATIAFEDKNFYKHGAFDLRAIIRAGFNDVFNRSGGVQGGSTISQQVVKLNQDWTEDRTIARKVKELILAVELEREYSKDDILNGYLNIAPYGGILYGVESAARDYFGVSAADLTLAQSALLAGVPQSPTFYSPYLAMEDQETREALIGRQQHILGLMVEQGMITQQQADEAMGVDVLAQVKPRQTKYENIQAPYFVLAAKQELEDRYGPDTVMRSGWNVTTTLDLNLQRIAEEQVKKGLKQVQSQKGDNIAFAAMDVKTAQMVALVGGVDFANPDFGQNNYAASIKLPPGSSFKPYDYMAMIENTTNTGAGSVLYDEQVKLPNYPCDKKGLPPPKGDGNCLHDYDFKFPGPLTVRYSLARSRNVPAVKAMLSVVPGNTTASVNKTIELAESMGLRSGYKCYKDEKNTIETQCYEASAIGDGAYLYMDEHVNGYATMARLGTYLPKTYILKITDEKGKIVDEWKQPKGEQVVRPDSAYIVADILSDPNASYMSRKPQEYKNSQGTWKFAVKTGTTNDNKDGWMMGTSTHYAAGVWVGHHTRQVEMRPFMETMTQPVFEGWMKAAHEKLAPVNWQKPGGIKSLAAFVIRTNIGSGSAKVPSPDQDVYPEWYQPPNRSGNNQETFDKVSNKVATSCTPELAKETKTGGNAEIFSADIFHGSGSNNTSDTDDIHNCNDTKPSITFFTPSTCSNETDCVFIVTVTQGTHAISSDRFPGTVNLIINGQVAESRTISSSPETVTFTYRPPTAGTGTVEAQVIDSVLYSSSQSTNVTFTPTP